MSRQAYDELKDEILSDFVTEKEQVIIHNETDNKYFGFMRQYPGICTSGETSEEVSKKLKTLFEKIEKMGLIKKFRQ